jgi:serine/threonine protein phosphatase PrpC
VWDELSDEEAVEIVKSVDDPFLSSSKLKDSAFILGSDDNIRYPPLYKIL